jgi:hypothetical protein
MLESQKELCGIEARAILAETLLLLEVMEELSAIDKAKEPLAWLMSVCRMYRTYARTRYSFWCDWKLNLRGTMKGQSTRERTALSASVCVISFRSTMCALEIVLSA